MKESEDRNNRQEENEAANTEVKNAEGTRKENLEEKKTEKDIEQKEDQKLEEYGQMTLDDNEGKRKIHLLTIIGEIEGHENLSSNSKATKYDHVLPKLAEIEDDDSVEGLLVLLNTSGGDVDAGLAIAEMIASLSIPTVSLVLGGSHSIGVPLAVSTNYSFIVPTGTMMIHPVRMTGMVIGASQTYEYFEMIQDRILSFVSNHAKIAYDQLKRLMLNTEMLTRDLGTVLVGEETVKEGLIDEVGGIKDALKKLYELMETASS
ncbi:ATP-dependent protease ClpP protease subunit [Lacrimispora xylanisolvens]|uniref:ATP-dependent protease ClpP protease subunit n=1 Tax=Lacrimispora xylanisolvens TaxID=384636 RepID=A0A2S6HRL2_9FIRM|nr:ATP-dependent Clp protease proteolytic subunit [Hungatella xylanolytica]MBE5988447.1 peptidase S14 [Paenibacillaceae bacterium]PPK80195.1 ATP-dependent protease ClpP protease subunit [Hungatella xylanolytica]